LLGGSFGSFGNSPGARGDNTAPRRYFRPVRRPECPAVPAGDQKAAECCGSWDRRRRRASCES
jgi:hypothetical protein